MTRFLRSASALSLVLFGSHIEAQAAQPVLQSRVAPILTVDGLTFRDLNRNGRLDPYEDWRLDAQARADDLTGRMTVEEKAGLMMFASLSGFAGPGGAVMEALAPPPPGVLKSPVNVAGVPGFDRADKPSPRALILDKHVRWLATAPVGSPADAARWSNGIQELAEQDRLGIPVVVGSDPIHTTNRLPGGELPPPDRVKPVSSWPDQIGLGAIGDPTLVERFGRISAAESRAMGYRVVINPMADTVTEPRWNRIPGTFGEDANLNARLITAFIRGTQGERIGNDSVLTVVKHFPGDGPVGGGLDPHNVYGKHFRYPAGKQELHLKPFEAAIAAGTASMMTAYGVPDGLDRVASSFSKAVVTDLLRGRLGYDGIVVSDWLHAMPWGVEHLSKQERQERMVAAGVDQFGGEHEPGYIVASVKAGRTAEARIDQSARRILKPMFELGLFENPYVDVDRAERIVKAPEFLAAAQEAQRRAVVLLKNARGALPLKAGARVKLEGFAATPAAFAGRTVADARSADAIIVKVNAPYRINKTGQSFFKGTHEGPLVYAGAENAGDLALIRRAIASRKPVIVTMSMERPAVLSEFLGKVDGMIATFGSDDAAVADIILGRFNPSGRLPFDLPVDEASVETQKEDAPHDFARTLFRQGFGLSYSPINKNKRH
ncbi:glycoside hydrolase family 3 protein [Sphingobium sp.]|uniref:glycoside hydrolase family 3 protein n=1 Tax=Sphingobium sp. TaxID=1912891 RepID=UPI0035C70F0F